jgi:hypothetical protein
VDGTWSSTEMRESIFERFREEKLLRPFLVSRTRKYETTVLNFRIAHLYRVLREACAKLEVAIM